MARSHKPWATLPGGWHALNIHRRHYLSNNQLGIPSLRPNDIFFTPAQVLYDYNHRASSRSQHSNAICHFFLDDYRFERVWTKPLISLKRVLQFRAAMTPDFSLYTDWPVVMQQWNTYRSRWIGRYWQEAGAVIIPTVNWSDADSLNWCFMGLPSNSTVAISVPDVRNPIVAKDFSAGFFAMVDIIKPTQIITYGKLPFAHELSVEFTPDWVKRRDAINEEQLRQTA